MKVTVSWRNANPGTIWGVLEARLGRSPTDAEASAEVRRILEEAHADMAARGELRWQKRGPA